MSTPTQQFSTLCLPDDTPDPSETGPMLSFERTTLEERKIIVRDIIASFEPYLLPSECLGPGDLERITENQGERRIISEWIFHDDLKKTLMYFCCYDKDWWTLFNTLHRAPIRALTFEQKVERRLETQFRAHDALANNGPRGTASEVNMWAMEIRRQMGIIIQEIGVDINTRTEGQYHAARILLQTMEKICQRDVDLPTTRRSERQDSSGLGLGTPPTLYQGLVEDGSMNLILDALETVQGKWPRSLTTTESQVTMTGVRHLLRENGAPEGYLARFDQVMTG